VEGGGLILSQIEKREIKMVFGEKKSTEIYIFHYKLPEVKINPPPSTPPPLKN
jgi:hypothetical protein